MRAGVEHDLRFQGEHCVDEDRLPVERAERRHRTDFTLREQTPELLFIGKANPMATCQFQEAIEIHD